MALSPKQNVGFAACMLILFFPPSCFAQLTANFYSRSCPNLETMVLNVMKQAVAKEPRMAASILRLFFHDCFVQGCDGSVLLDDQSNFQGEKTAIPNISSLRGFDVIDNIKTEVEAACEGVVSCADILALAARDAVALSNGPSWNVMLGRRDSTTASLNEANNDLPFSSSTDSTLISKFQAKGLSVQDMVALSGSHTLGQARCITFRRRLYNQTGNGQPDSTLNTAYLSQLRRICPFTGGDSNLSPMDIQTPTRFDNQYFINLQNLKGLLNSDEVLYTTSGSPTIAAVNQYAQNQNKFYTDFTSAMIRMGNISPLTGSTGETRKNCRIRN